MSNDPGGRRPRPAANTVSSPPMGSGVAILVTAVALILGFLILHKVNDTDTTVTGGGGGGTETTVTTPSTGSTAETTATTTPGVFTGTMVQVANCSAQNGVARMMSSALGDAGFTMAEPTNGTCDPKLTTSYVVYNEGTPGAIDVANTVAKVLGGIVVQPGTVPLAVETAAWAEGSAVLLYLGNDLAGKTLDQIQGVAVSGVTTIAPVAGSTVTT